jgi:acetolactate decarboxylase
VAGPDPVSDSTGAHPQASHGHLRHFVGTMLAHRHGHGVHHDAARAHALYQTSTISALLNGIYDGSVTIAELLEHGDFGLGTFNHLDGEMVIDNGECFQLFSDGSAQRAHPDTRTPFAAVTWFDPDLTFDVSAVTNRTELLERIDQQLSSENLFHAVRISGSFATMSTRTVARQEAPYPPLTEVAASESKQTSSGSTGAVLGFRAPDYEQGVAVAGYHLHFLNHERTGGGHVLDFVLERGRVEVSTLSEIHLSLPRSGPFLTADLHGDEVDAAIRKSES